MKHLLTLALFAFGLDVGAQITSLSVETVIEHDGTVAGLEDLAGYTTYRVYAETTLDIDFVSAVFGESANPLVIETSGSFFQQQETGEVNFGFQINPFWFITDPSLEFDSWLTIGDENILGNDSVGFTASTLEQAFSLFNNGQGFVIDDPIGAAWYNVVPQCFFNEDPAACSESDLSFGGEDNRVLLAQLTSDADIFGILNVQTFAAASQNNAFLQTGLTFSSNPDDIFGCTQEDAFNFSSTATIDDYSCVLPCTVELNLESVVASSCGGLIQVAASGAQGADYYYLDSVGTQVGQNFGNFGGLAAGSYTVFVVDGVGCVDSISVDVPAAGCFGCTDSSACNYAPSASTDDGSCNYPQEFYDCEGNSLCGPASLSTLTVEVTENVQGDLDVYRLYVDLPPNDNWYVSAVAADQNTSSDNPMRLATMFDAPEGVFNSPLNSSWNAQGISAGFLSVFPELAFDSYATIGLSGPSIESTIPNASAPSFAGDVQTTNDFTTFFTSDGVEELNMFDGLWYILPSTYQQGLADEDGRCLIGQICTSGSLQGQLIVQILQSDALGSTVGEQVGDSYYVQGEVARYSFNSSGVFEGVGFETDQGADITDFASLPICGCNDANASNYIPWAEVGTDTCEYQCGVDADNDGICDDVDDCIGEYDACGICNGSGGAYACGCEGIPEGNCDCDGNQLDEAGVCGGDCLADENGNGVCDNSEVYGCTYELAENYASEATYDDGSCIFPCEGVVNTNVFDWDGDYVVTVTDFLMMLSVYGDTDVDLDGVWDSGDDCVDTNACNYANDPSEPCAYIDVLSVCGGGCEGDEDNDGICDDVDTCVGDLDECGVCNGPGPTEIVIDEIVVTYDSVFLPFDNEWFVFPVDADTTFSYTCAPYFGDCGDPVSYQGYDYVTVLIGDQCWFAENLRSENYENGDAIPANLSDSEWSSTTSGALAVYGEDAGCSNYSPDIDACDPAQSLNEYGRLYNWYAVADARGLCPSGWHVPTDGEWMTMEMALGMSDAEANDTGFRGTDQGAQMKTDYGWYNGANGTNSSGFSGLPGGFRNSDGYFDLAGANGKWWSSSPNGSSAWYRGLQDYNEDVYRNHEPNFSLRYGFSVRCVRDAE